MRARAHDALGGLVTVVVTASMIGCGGGRGAPPAGTPVDVTDGGRPDGTTIASDGSVDAGGAGNARDGGDTRADASPAPTGAEMAHLVGRVDDTDPAGPRLAWPGSAIEVRFRGTGLDVRLHDTNVDQLAVTIDGKPPVVVKMTATVDVIPVARALAEGDHVATLTKRTETFFGTMQLLGVTALAGADGGAPGTLLSPPPKKAHAIEIVGDSITCGYGDEGVGPTCTFSPDTENEAMAYGAEAAAALDADHVAVAWSGKGVVRNYDGLTDETMPTLWTRTRADDASSVWDFRWKPDVVVVSLGTNDFAKGDPGAPFASAYAAFVATLRAHYPSAFIVCATSALLGGTERDALRSYLKGVVDAAHARGDAKVSLLDFDEQLPADGYGCDYHPSGVTHAKMSDELVAHVRTLTGW